MVSKLEPRPNAPCTFPDDRTLGLLSVIYADPGDRDSPLGPSWWWGQSERPLFVKLFAVAKGDVVGPVGARFYFQFYSPLNKERLGRLDQFIPDRLESLRLKGIGRSGDDALAQVSKLTGLKRLYLEKIAITTQCLARLQTLSGLDTLYLTQSRLGQAEFDQLAKLKSLKNLSLYEHSTPISSASLAAVARLPLLEHLILNIEEPDSQGLVFLTKLPRLRTLELHFNYKTGSRNLRALTRCPALEHLYVSGISPEDLSHIGEFSALKGLRLAATDLREIAKIKGLEELCLDTPIESEGLAHLTTLTSLKVLKLSDKPITSEGLSNLVRFPALERLYLGELPQGGLSLLGKLSHLKYLRLNDYFSPEDLGALAAFNNLETLSFEDYVRDEGLARVASIKSLRRLTLSHPWEHSADISSASLGRLSKLPKLESFDCDYNLIGGDGLRQIAYASSLKTLRLVNSYDLVDEDVACLSRLQHLDDLCLSGDYLSDKALDALAQISTLRRLEFMMPGPEITEAGLDHLRRALPGIDLRIPWQRPKNPDAKSAYLANKARLMESINQNKMTGK